MLANSLKPIVSTMNTALHDILEVMSRLESTAVNAEMAGSMFADADV